MLPFGCRVMAHVSVSNQSNHAIIHYYICPAFTTKQGILLYNPKTKQIIVRRSYQTLSDTSDSIIPNHIISTSSTEFPIPVTPTNANQLPAVLSNVSSENKNCAALPVQPDIFPSIINPHDTPVQRRSKRLDDVKQFI